MHLLFICNEYPPTTHGGVGSFVLTLARHLALQGQDVHVIGFDGNGAQSMRENEGGIHVTRLHSPFKDRQYLRWGRYDIAAQVLERMYLSQQVRAYCEQHNIELVESYDWSGPLWFTRVLRCWCACTVPIQPMRFMNTGVLRASSLS